MVDFSYRLIIDMVEKGENKGRAGGEGTVRAPSLQKANQGYPKWEIML